MEASKTEIGILKETAWGVLPSPASFQAIPVTGESLKINKENVVSDIIRPDRNVADLIQVGGDAAGGIDSEMLYDAFDDLIESALFGTWTANELVNGVTQNSFHIQKKQTGNDDTTTYELYRGMVVDTWDLNIEAKSKITTAFAFLGKNGATSATATGTTTEQTDGEVFDASNAFTFSELLISPLPNLMSLSMNVANNLAGRPSAGSADLLRVSSGRCVVTGSMSLYFQSKALMDLFIAGTSGGLTFTIGKTTGEKYTIEIPKIKLSDADHFSPGNDEDVMFNCNWQAIYDDTLEGVIKVTRAVS
jgi:hypothetical protein